MLILGATSSSFVGEVLWPVSKLLNKGVEEGLITELSSFSGELFAAVTTCLMPVFLKFED